MKILYISFLIHFLFLFPFIQSIVNIPFYIEQYDVNNFNFTNYFLKTNIIAEFKIGTPSQNIKSLLFTDESTFYLLNTSYNIQNSETYIKKKEINKKFIGESVFNAEDTVIFKNEKNEEIIIQNFPFLIVTNSNKNTKPNCIGLSPSLILKNNNDNFFNILENKNIIKSQIFTIKFDNNNPKKGEIIIGGYPSEYDKKYNNKYYEYTHLIKDENYNEMWKIDIDKFYYDNNIVMDKYVLEGDFDINVNGIFIIQPLIEYLDQNFFNPYIFNDTCSVNNISERYFYYICDKNIDLKLFKNIKMYCRVLNFTFELKVEELIEEIMGKYYFLIFYDSLQPFRWTLGLPFLKKYQMVFNQNKKTVGFYTKFDEQKSSYFIIIIIFFLLVIIGFLIYIYFKYFNYKKRKLRSNEIDDIYYYST